MTEIVLDIEANSLTPTIIWGLCATVLGPQPENHSFTEPEAFNDFLAQHKGATLYAHNGIGYDYYNLARLWGACFGGVTLRDTMVLSRLAVPDRDGGHSLEAWGAALGFPKGDFDDWLGGWTTQMHMYCRQDVAVTVKVLEVVKRELDGFSEECIELEHDAAAVIAKQVRAGWLLDERRCLSLLAELKDKLVATEAEVHNTFGPLPTFIKEVTPKKKMDGSFSVVGLKWMGDDWQTVVGPVSRVVWQEFNLGSRQQIARWLQYYGWVPTHFTDKGAVIVGEEILENVEQPEAQLIAKYLMYGKRIAAIESWLSYQDDDGRVRAGVASNGANTGRMTHFSPNLSQVTSGKKPYGMESRACWTTREGYKLVGWDADGLELRTLAHYMKDESFTKAVVEGNKSDGTDAHTRNQRSAGLATRDDAKTFIYAFLYGAGDAKIGSIAGGGAAKGKKLKADFLRNTPALAALKEAVEKASGRGWLRGLDGRRIRVRSRHSALNALLQGAGAILMKKALVLLDQQVVEWGLDSTFVGNIHDEVQAEVHEKAVQKYSQLAEWAFTEAGKQLNFRCPLAIGIDVGNNWSETH